jgi:hypothetical protein
MDLIRSCLLVIGNHLGHDLAGTVINAGAVQRFETGCGSPNSRARSVNSARQ